MLQLQWKNVFYLAAEIYAFGGLTYLILSSGELQSWAKVEKKSGDNDIPAISHVSYDEERDSERERLYSAAIQQPS